MAWLAIGYPVLAHLAVLLHSVHLQWLALVWLLALSLGGALLRRRIWAWCSLLAGAALLYALVTYGNGLYALYLPAAVIPASFFVLFARSLRRDTVPVVSRIATAMRGEPLPAVLVAYTRRVTQLWCGIFALMFASAAVTAIWASPELWSLMTNVVHYLLSALVFAAEFFYRRVKYRDLEPWNFLQFLRRLVRTRIRI